MKAPDRPLPQAPRGRKPELTLRPSLLANKPMPTPPKSPTTSPPPPSEELRKSTTISPTPAERKNSAAVAAPAQAPAPAGAAAVRMEVPNRPLPVPRARPPEPTVPQTSSGILRIEPVSNLGGSVSMASLRGKRMSAERRVPSQSSTGRVGWTGFSVDWSEYRGNDLPPELSDDTDHSDDMYLDRPMDMPIPEVNRFHERLLEGYRCWLDKTGQSSRARNLQPVEKLREILLWRVLFALSEAAGFCPEHLASCFHQIISNKLTGTRESPFLLDINALQRGIPELSQGEVNLDDINLHAMNNKPAPLRKTAGGRTLQVHLFDQTVFFCHEGDEPMDWYFQQHIDTQARNVEKLLGKFVPASYVSVPHEKAFTGSGKPQPALKPPATKVEKQEKYFHEPAKWGVIILILRNWWAILTLKVWALIFAIAVNQDLSGKDFLQKLATADAVMLILDGVVSFIARLMVYRWRLFRGMPYGGVMNVVVFVCKCGGVALAVAIASGFANGFFEMAIAVPAFLVSALPWFFTDGALLLTVPALYIIGRIVCFALYNLYLWVAFSPQIKGTPTDTSLSTVFKKKIRWRVFGTFFFWVAVLALTAAFEILVLIPAVRNLTPETLCQCKGLIECTYQAPLNCWLTLVVMWSLIWVSFLLDTHVAFVFLLSIIGLFVGLSSSLRPSRLEQLRIDPHRLIDGIKAKWLGSAMPVKKAMDVWNRIVDEMWEADIISETHQKQLKIGDTIPDEEWIIELPVEEAQERLAYFYNSLSMETCTPPTLDDIPSVSTLIPSYDETIVFTYEELRRPHFYGGKPGPTDLGYLISCHPAEWDYFVARLKVRGYLPWNWTPLMLYDAFIEKRLPADGPVVDKIRLWASFRAQTVARTIRGVSYYRKVLRELGADDRTLRRKYQVVLCLQTYASYDAAKVSAVNLLVREFPFVEIVYDYDREMHNKPQLRPHVEKLAFLQGQGVEYAIVREEWNAREQQLEITGLIPRMWPILLGPEGRRVQGKAQNQRNGLMYCWGEFIQTLDANQDFTFEDALKVPTLLMHFYQKGGKHGAPQKDKVPRYRIIGFREKIFTGNLSLTGKFMALADFSFTTIFNRILANPLSVRMHYGHPDFFDGMWVLGRSGLNKASPVINLNEDIYAGYTVTLRSQRITHKEFLQASKGRETSLRLSDQFEAKLAEGAAAQMRSSDLFELNQRLNFFKKISLFHGSIGFYLIMTVMSYSIFLYVSTLLLFSLAGIGLQELGELGSVYSTELAIALGLVYMLPGIIEMLIAYGPRKFVSIVLNFLPSALFFGFLLQTKAANLSKSVVSGNATYRATGRKLTIERFSLKSNFLTFIETHFLPGLRLLGLITLYHVIALYNLRYVGVLPLFTPTILAFTWVLVPVLFNPFPSFEATTADGKEIWSWLTKNKDLDLCALSYSHPKGEKRLGVPPRRDVDEDSWNNWYILKQATWLKNSFESKGDTVIYCLVTILFTLVLTAFVISVAPSSLLCAIYLLLVGMLVLFLVGIRQIVDYIGKERPGTAIIHIVLDITLVALLLVFLIFTPIAVANAFNFVDYLVALFLLAVFLRLIRDFVYLALAPRMRHKPKVFVSTIYFLEHATLQTHMYWFASCFIVALQLLLAYALSLFPKLHTTFLFNPNLTTRTHGVDRTPKGTIRKIEKAVARPRPAGSSAPTDTKKASKTGPLFRQSRVQWSGLELDQDRKPTATQPAHMHAT